MNEFIPWVLAQLLGKDTYLLHLVGVPVLTLKLWRHIRPALCCSSRKAVRILVTCRCFVLFDSEAVYQNWVFLLFFHGIFQFEFGFHQLQMGTLYIAHLKVFKHFFILKFLLWIVDRARFHGLYLLFHTLNFLASTSNWRNFGVLQDNLTKIVVLKIIIVKSDTSVGSRGLSR